MMPTVVRWRAVHGAHRTVLQLSSPTPYALATSLIGLEESMTSRHSSSLNSVLKDRRDLLMLVRRLRICRASTARFLPDATVRGDVPE